jgi:5-methylcytosine-specific restriction endonuclease McrA
MTNKELKAYCQDKAEVANRRAQPKIQWIDVLLVMAKAQGKCRYCGTYAVERNLPGINPHSVGTLEHIIPVNRGGTNNRRNLAWACLYCNQKGYWRE